jgi:hypothetical protein
VDMYVDMHDSVCACVCVRERGLIHVLMDALV